MSTLKSSAEHLTLNADGSGNDIKFQSNATEVAAIDQAGNLTLSGTVDGVDVAATGALATNALPKAGGTMTGAFAADTINNASGNLTIASTQSILMKFDSDNNQTNREFNIQNNSGDQILKITEAGVSSFTGNVGIGTTTPFSSNWGSAGANKELAIDGTTGYGVLHLRGTGSGSTNTKFSIGVGDDNLYLAYDEVDSVHRIIVDGTGAVTMPTQPAFQASKSSSTAIANATWVTLVFNNERFDNNADYNPSNGVFTAPITGKYQMNFSARIDSIPHTAAHASVQFTSSNVDYSYQSLITPTSYDSTLNYITFHASSLIDMDAGDTVKCTSYIQNGSGTHVAYAGNIFSGYLVC